MSGLDMFAMRFALASFACLAAGLGIWPVAALCRKYLPALALQRSVWMLAQLAIAATFIFALLPQTEELRVVPAIEVNEQGRFTPQESTPEPAEPALAAPVAAAPSTNWPLRAAQGWLLVYTLGFAVALLRLLRAQRALGQLARAGVPLRALDEHAGFGAGAGAPTVLDVDAAISPMLIGLLQPRLLLPLQLRQFDASQQRLIIAHELTHWRRHDLQWMGAAVALQTIFWFHPIMRQLRQNLCWAQELACDQAVLQGRAPVERKAYAAALLAAENPQPAAGRRAGFRWRRPAQHRLAHRPDPLAVFRQALPVGPLRGAGRLDRRGRPQSDAAASAGKARERTGSSGCTACYRAGRWHARLHPHCRRGHRQAIGQGGRL